MKFDPPIASRDTDELIGIANGTTEHWQQEAIDQAKLELVKRNVSRKYQDKKLKQWEKREQYWVREGEKIHQKEIKKGYTISEMIGILIFAFPILMGRSHHGRSLLDLKKEGYKKKFKQRLILLILGVIFYIIFLFSLPYLLK